MKRNILALLISVIAFATLFTSCSMGNIISETSDSLVELDDFYYSESAKGDYNYAMDGVNSSPSIESPKESYTADESSNDLQNRKIIKTANISFQTKTYDEFMASITMCINAYGGYIETSESRGGGVYQTNYLRNAYITARIPENNYNAFMNDACNLGSVTYKSENSSDITLAYVDTESRIKALEAEYDALIGILEKATKLDDVIQLQSRISDVTYQLESYKSQIRKYDDLVSYCTVTLNINEVQKEVKNEEKMTLGERIADGFDDTMINLQTGFEDFTVWFVTSLPYLLIWALIIFLIVVIIKASIKRIIKKIKAKKSNENKE